MAGGVGPSGAPPVVAVVQVGAVICPHKDTEKKQNTPTFSQRFRLNWIWAGGTLEGDGGGAGPALAGRSLDGLGGVVACAGRPGYGPPLGDNGRLAKGDDGVLVFQASVVIQRGQPSFPVTSGLSVQLLSEDTGGESARPPPLAAFTR